MNILVTGAAGLLGSNFCKYLIDNKLADVTGVDNLTGGYRENLPEAIKFVQLNIGNNNDYNMLDGLFVAYKFDYVFHFAAYAAEGLSPFIRMFNYQNNLVASAAVINLCIKHKVKRLVFTSSMAVYGNQTPPFDEDLIPSPIDPYGIAKYAVEMDLAVAHNQHGLEYCIIRPHNVFGPNQNIWDRYRNVIGIFMYQALHNEPISVFGDGEQKRAFTYIDNILQPLFKAAVSPNAKNQIINLGGIKEYSINDIAKLIPGNNLITHLEARHEVKNAWSTYIKSVSRLDYKETINVEDGIKIMWEWVKQQPDRARFKWNSYELSDKIYSFWK